MAFASTLIINGTSYAQPARHTHGLILDAWGWDLDSDFWAEFHEIAAGPQPQFYAPFSAQITMADGGAATPVFTGQIVDVQPGPPGGPDGRTWNYRALGLKNAANWIPVTGIDGSGLIRFNVSPIDVFNYIPSMAGQSVGQIVQFCLTQHASALSAAGITTDSTTASQLAALTLVPNNEVDVRGERLWQSIEGVFQQWARNIRTVILPSGLVRFVDLTTGTVESFTCGVDPIEPPMWPFNWSNCATRVVVRGQGLIEPGFVQTQTINSIQSLTPAWTTAEQNAWNEQDFANPQGATDHGSASVTSATTINCTSVNTSLTLAANYWDTVVGWIYLQYSVGSGLAYTESRAITASTATTTGVYTVTVNFALTNTTYDSYQIIGTAVPLADGGLSLVWRLYNVTDPGGQIANHLVRQFPVPVPFITTQAGGGSNGGTLTSYPIALVTVNTNDGVGTITEGVSVPFTVLPATGQILFTRPVVELSNTPAILATGGAGVVAPANIFCMLAYSRGALETVYPPNVSGAPQFSGTAFTVNGLERTQFVDIPDWTYFGDVSVLSSLAQMLQASVCNTVIEGPLRYYGLNSTFFSPTGGSTPGWLLNVHGNGYTTGLESVNIPVRRFTLRYLADGDGGLNYVSDFSVSSRLDPRTGPSYYDHLNVLGKGVFTPRSGEAFAGGSFAAPDSSNPFGFGDEEPPDLSDMGSALGLDGDMGNGKYTPDQTRKQRLKQRQQDSQTFPALAAPQSTVGRSGAAAAVPVLASGAGVNRLLESMNDSGLPSNVGDLTPLVESTPAPDVAMVQPKPKPQQTTLPGAPQATPTASPTIPSRGTLPDTFMADSEPSSDPGLTPLEEGGGG
jgi:hypothetical protein